MNIKGFHIIISILFMASIVSCGAGSDITSISLSGTIDVEDIIDDINGPIMVAITKSDDFEKIEDDPLDTIIDMRAIDESNYTFNMDLSDKGLKEGDEIYIFGFVDNDYADGIPNPNEGDYIGFYVDPAGMSLSYSLKVGLNSNINIKINRRIFSFEAEVSGTVTGSDAGDLILIAYAGEIESLDFTSFDFDEVIGYKMLTKHEAPLPYNMKILPFGYDVPIENVYVIAILDKNSNGLIDAGDIIGFHTENEDHFPTLLTINEGEATDKNIEMLMEIPQPSGYNITINGSFEKPAGYDEYSKPVYIIIADTDDPSVIFEDPMSVIKYFQKLPAGENEFNIDLSGTNLVPDDEVFVIALWDKDYTAGFPYPSEDDLIGYLQNKDEFSFTLKLQDGVNIVPSNGYEFKVNKIMYNHDSSITFQLEEGVLTGDDYEEGDKVIMIAVQEDGFNILSNEIDMDYILGTATIEIDSDTFSGGYSNMGIFPAIYEEIDVGNPFAIDNVYIFAILDNNDANGMPDEGEYFGFYWDRFWLIVWIYYPITYDLSDGENLLSKTVRFSGTY